jgi:AsmA protein
LSQGGSSQSGGRPGGQRSIPSPTSPAEASTEPGQATPTLDASAAEPVPPAPPGEATAQQDSQPMNDVLRQLFNR